MEHIYGKFYSWTIENETVAYKKSDKSFFAHNGSAIPADIAWFFGADKLGRGTRRDVKYVFNGSVYDGHIERGADDLGRARVFWEAKLGVEFAGYDNERNYPTVRFEKTTANSFEITFDAADDNASVTEWIISGNPKKYDFINAFRTLKKIDWKQSNNIHAGDIVYVYVSGDLQRVCFKCRANKVDFENQDIEDSQYNISDEYEGTYGRYMELEMLEEFDSGMFSRLVMEKHGFSSPQSQVRVPAHVKKYMDVVQHLFSVDELDPDEHDGSYALVRGVIEEYAKMADLTALDYKDLNLVYLMSVGTWKQKIPAKKIRLMIVTCRKNQKNGLFHYSKIYGPRRKTEIILTRSLVKQA